MMRRLCIPPLAASVAACLTLVASASAHAATAGPAAPKSITIAFSDAREVPSVGALTTDLSYAAAADCAGKPVNGTRTLAQAIAQAKAIEDKAGKPAVKAVNSGRDGKAAEAELDASAALTDNNPVGALAALTAAYGKNPKDGTILRDLGSVLAQLGQPLDALALFDKADKSRGTVQHPMGISETATELNDRGFALLELRRWPAAKIVLAKAVKDAPLLAEAKLNLGNALLCESQSGHAQRRRAAGSNPITMAAKMIFEGSRRDAFRSFSTLGTVTIAPLRKVIDVSHDKAGTWPTLDFPRTMTDVDNDSDTFGQLSSNAFTTSYDETQEAASLLASVTLPPISQERITDLQNMAGDSAAGGWADEENEALADGNQVNNFTSDTYAANGPAASELMTIQAAGGDPCSVQRPEMRAWLTGRTKTFSSYMQTWDSDQRGVWLTESRWVSGVDANIANPAINLAFTYDLDAQKQAYLVNLAQAVSAWAVGATEFSDSFGSCDDTLAPAQPVQTGAIDHIDKCPNGLQKASFSLSLGFFTIGANCEQVTAGASAPGLGPFAKVTFSRSGDITIVAGVKAGTSIGPVSAGANAGVYVTVHDGTVSDVGLTVSGKLGLSGDPISLSGPAANATVSFVNATGIATSFSY
jgi:tetratricopeptide repeat protein